MKTLQKFGGFAALYMAISHLIGFALIALSLALYDRIKSGAPALIMKQAH